MKYYILYQLTVHKEKNQGPFLASGKYSQFFYGYRSGTKEEMISNFRELEARNIESKTYAILQYFPEEDCPSSILNQYYYNV